MLCCALHALLLSSGGGTCRGEVSDAMMAALGLDVGANLSAEERFRQVAAVMKRRDAQDRRDQKELRCQQKLDKKVRTLVEPNCFK